MSLPKKIDLLRDFAAGVYLSEAPSPSRFVWGGKAILQVLYLVRHRGLNPAEYGLQHNSTPPPSQPHTVCTVRCLWEGVEGGRGELLRSGYSSQSWVETTNITDCISRL